MAHRTWRGGVRRQAPDLVIMPRPGQGTATYRALIRPSRPRLIIDPFDPPSSRYALDADRGSGGTAPPWPEAPTGAETWDMRRSLGARLGRPRLERASPDRVLEPDLAAGGYRLSENGTSGRWRTLLRMLGRTRGPKQRGHRAPAMARGELTQRRWGTPFGRCAVRQHLCAAGCRGAGVSPPSVSPSHSRGPAFVRRRAVRGGWTGSAARRRVLVGKIRNFRWTRSPPGLRTCEYF